MTTSEDHLQVLKIATMRLREALDMERKTSGGNPMTPLSVARFLSGPWLDYIAEPYKQESDYIAGLASADPLRAALARVVEAGYADGSVDGDLYLNDPVYHAVVYEARTNRAALAARVVAVCSCPDDAGADPNCAYHYPS